MSNKNIYNKRIDAQLSESSKRTKEGKAKKRKEKSFPPKNKEEANKILNNIWQRNQTLSLCFSISALTGLRYSDASWLEYGDFYDEFGRFKPFFDLCQQKSYRMRCGRMKAGNMDTSTAFRKSIVRVYNNNAIREIVEDCRILNPDSKLLFPNSRSKVKGDDGINIERPMSVDSANWHLNKTKNELQLGFNLGTHSFRKFFALMLVKQGASIEKIRDLLGHDSIVSTNSYLHSFIDDLEIHTSSLRLDDD
jgi:integrase